MAVVGPDGRGHVWHAHTDPAGDEGADQRSRFSIAPPPPLPPWPEGDYPDDEEDAGGLNAGEDGGGGDAAQADPEVGLSRTLYG